MHLYFSTDREESGMHSDTSEGASKHASSKQKSNRIADQVVCISRMSSVHLVPINCIIVHIRMKRVTFKTLLVSCRIRLGVNQNAEAY